MFSSMKKIIAILLCVTMTLTNAGVSTFATSIERVATTAKQIDSNRKTIDYRFYEAFKYEKRTSYLMKDDESDSLKESMQQSEPSSVVGENTKTGDDVSPSFDVGNNDANDDKSRATSSDADDDSENDDENTTGNNIEEPEDDGANNKVSDDDTDTATVSDADDSSGSAATDEPEDDDTDTATVSDVDDSSGSAATDETEDDDIDTATTSDADTTVNSSTNDEDENGDTTATTSDAADKEASNKNDENDDTTATTSNADVLNDDNKASDSDAKKLPLNLQPMIASDSESTLFGVTAYTLPNTWYNVTSAGASKYYVQSITISKYPTPAPTTYTHNYTIPGSDGLEVYANVTGSGTSQRSDVIIYAPEDKTIYAAENSSGMFFDFEIMTNLDLSSFDTSKVTNMYIMFSGCSALTSLDVSSFNTASVSNMTLMFSGCRALTSLDLSSFDTSNVTNMSYMFNTCQALTSLNLSSFDTSNVTNMRSMFNTCQALTSLNLSSFDTSNVTNMSSMFNTCQALTSLNVSNFDTRNVTDMTTMFYNCQTLTSLDLSSFDTSNLTIMSHMFNGCRALTSLDLSSFDTSKVTNMYGMFKECRALTSLDVSSFDTSNVIRMNYMFAECHDLTTIIASTSFVTTAVPAGNDSDMFTNCSALEGGNGTKWSDRNAADPTTAIDKTYAWIDGRHTQGGYFRGTGDGSGSGTDGDGTKVHSIRVKASPSKIDYKVTDHFNPAGLVLEVQWTDGYKSEVIYNSTTERDFTFNPATTSELQLTDTNVVITYKGAHTTFNISVRDWYADENVSSIKITKKPQTKYIVDDTLNPTGLEIEVTYTDGRSNRTVAYNNNKAMFTFNPNTTKKLQLSDKKVTVSFGGMKASYDIVVEEIPVDEGVSDIKIIKPPVQVNYIVGQKLDPSGLVIEVAYKVGSKNYKDGTKKQVSYDEYVNKFSFNPNTDKTLALTDENVTVTFGGKTDIFAITVIEAVDLDKDVSSIKIKKVPDKVNYYVSEKLNPSGLVMEVTYSNNTNNLLTKLYGNNIKAGKTFLVDYNTYTDLFSLVPGTEQLLNINNKIVTVTFGGKKATFDITVSKNSNAYGPSNGGGGGGRGGGGRVSGGLPDTEINTVVETMTLSSDYDWMYDEEGQREGVKLKKDSALAKSLMSSNDYKANYKESIEEGYIQIQNGFYNLQYAGASFYFGFSPAGKMLTGFVKTKDDTKHYWVDDTKNTLINIGKQNSAKYYLYKENGDYKGIIWSLPITIGNTLYTFDESGRVLTETPINNNEVVAFSNTGWEYNPTDDSWKYYNTDSVGNRYYIKDEVKEITDNGVSHYYIFGEDGKMKTGLTEYKGKTYYLLENGDYKGAVYTGMLPLGGKVLIFDEQGVLVSDNNEVKALTTTQ